MSETSQGWLFARQMWAHTIRDCSGPQAQQNVGYHIWPHGFCGDSGSRALAFEKVGLGLWGVGVFQNLGLACSRTKNESQPKQNRNKVALEKLLGSLNKALRYGMSLMDVLFVSCGKYLLVGWL